MMKLVVLGTSAAVPTKDYSSTSFALKYGGTYLFDACEGVQQQMMRHGVSLMKVEAIFLTHLHADHFLGVFGLIQTMNLQQRREELLIVGPQGTKRFFDALFATRILAPQTFGVQIKEVARSGKVFANELLSVNAFAVKHAGRALGYCVKTPSYRRFDKRKCEELGVRGHLFTFLQEKGVGEVVDRTGKRVRVKYEDVTYEQPGKKIVYSGDTLPCAAVVKQAAGAELLVHESTFGDDSVDVAAQKKHSTAAQAAGVAKKAGAKRLLLIHFSNRYEGRGELLKQAREIFVESECAFEGMEILV